MSQYRTTGLLKQLHTVYGERTARNVEKWFSKWADSETAYHQYYCSCSQARDKLNVAPSYGFNLWVFWLRTSKNFHIMPEQPCIINDITLKVCVVLRICFFMSCFSSELNPFSLLLNSLWHIHPQEWQEVQSIPCPLSLTQWLFPDNNVVETAA